MRNLKLSFALIVAVLAIGVTVATKANNFGKRAITDCFTSVLIADASNNQFTLVDGLANTDVVSEVAAKPYVLATSGTRPKAQCPFTAKFCCAEIVQTSDPLAPVVTIEGITGTFAISQVYYRN